MEAMQNFPTCICLKGKTQSSQALVISSLVDAEVTTFGAYSSPSLFSRMRQVSSCRTHVSPTKAPEIPQTPEALQAPEAPEGWRRLVRLIVVSNILDSAEFGHVPSSPLHRASKYQGPHIFS